MAKNAFQIPSECPVCGAEVPPGAKACPDCGADERTGWDEDSTRCDGLDLPDEAFDSESDSRQRKPWHQSALWTGVALTLLLILIVAFVAG